MELKTKNMHTVQENQLGHLGEIDMEQTIMVVNIGEHEIEGEYGTSRDTLAFEIRTPETEGNYIYMEVGTKFTHKNKSWKVIAIHPKVSDSNEKGLSGGSVVFEEL